MAEEIVKKQKTNKNYTFAVGRRREAVARVRIYESIPSDMKWDNLEVKKGDILVNGKPIADYFQGDLSRYAYTEPLRVVNAQNRYTITIKVDGGGPSGQLDAVVHGLAGALSKTDPEKYHKILKDKGFLTRDARARERRKVGTGGKARRKLQSPKR